MHSYDVVVMGAGAAGLFCAGVAGQLGLRVLVLDHSERVAEKIRISGGGRCNFTNRDVDPAAPHKHFLGDNPHFCRSALSRYTPQDFIALVQRHGIAFHEKHKGQLFCDRSADDLIQMLLAECGAGALGGHVDRWQPCSVKNIGFSATSQRETVTSSYQIESDRGTVECAAVVVATGGLSIPKIGATDFGYRVARQFGLRLVETRPGLVPLTFDEQAWAPYAQLSGLSLPVRIETGTKKARGEFLEDLLFTHRGLSGPAVLQISSYWREGDALSLDLLPGQDAGAMLRRSKVEAGRGQLAGALARMLPDRLARHLADLSGVTGPLAEVPGATLDRVAAGLADWRLVPVGSEGYRTAEVTLGGVDTEALDARTMQARAVPGLYFVGEVVDITGWLGGYNFQWAWSSGWAAGQVA